MTAPLGEVAPLGFPACQHPIPRITGVGLGAGGAKHLPNDHRVFTVFIQPVNGGDLIGYVHRDGVRHRGGGGRGLGGSIRQYHGCVIEDQVPGHFAYNAVYGDTVLLLQGFDGGHGFAKEIAADGAGVIAQLSQPGLQLLDQRTGGTLGQPLGIGDGSLHNGAGIGGITGFL